MEKALRFSKAIPIALALVVSAAAYGQSSRGDARVTPVGGGVDSTAGQQSFGSWPFKIVDAEGQFVGYQIGTQFTIRKVGSDWIVLGYLGPGGELPGVGTALLYASTDCTGQAWIEDHSGDAFQGFFGYGNWANGILYYGIPEEKAHGPVANSAKAYGGACFSYGDLGSGRDYPRAPAHEIALPLTPPFHLVDLLPPTN